MINLKELLFWLFYSKVNDWWVQGKDRIICNPSEGSNFI
jgi:hypothetical protein